MSVEESSEYSYSSEDSDSENEEEDKLEWKNLKSNDAKHPEAASATLNTRVSHNPRIVGGLHPSGCLKTSPGCAHPPGGVWGGDVARDRKITPPEKGVANTTSIVTGRNPALLKRNKNVKIRKRKRSVYNFHDEWDNSSGDLDSCEVRTSNIKNAGLGLFAIKKIKTGGRITKYSGKQIGRAEALASKSSYIVEIHKQLYLDADGPGHMAGRYINDGPFAGIPANARLGSSRQVYKCKKTGRFWIPVIALRNIRPGEEIIIKYGNKITWTRPPQSSEAPGPPSPGGDDATDEGQPENGEHSEQPDPNGDPDPPTSDPDRDTQVDPNKISKAFQATWLEYLKQHAKDKSSAENADPKERAAEWYTAICDSIQKAAKLHIPLRDEYKPTQRGVSDRTKSLIKRRIKLVSRGASKSALRKIRKQIKQSSLQDYKD